jgi:DNA-directed RNA polymerase specialized sigma24 family protein
MENASMPTGIDQQKLVSRLGRLRIPDEACDSLADFIEAVRPFRRIVYLVAFAYTKDADAAEFLAVNVLATAFKVGRNHGQNANEFKSRLIRIALSEARNFVSCNSPHVLENGEEEIERLITSQAIAGLRLLTKGATCNGVLPGTLIKALHELSPDTAVTLLLRDACHFTSLEISTLTGESQQKVQARLAYGRVALCMKLSNGLTDREVTGRQSFAPAY